MLRLNSVNSNGPAPPVADRAGAMQRAETVGPEMHIECEPRGLAKRRALQAQLHRGAPGVVLATQGRQNPSSKALRAGTLIRPCLLSARSGRLADASRRCTMLLHRGVH